SRTASDGWQFHLASSRPDPQQDAGQGQARRSSSWTQHSSGRIDSRPAADAPARIPVNELGQSTRAVPVEQFYRTLSGYGVDYGKAFRPLEELQVKDCRALVRLKADGDGLTPGPSPAQLDGALQAVAALLSQTDGEPQAWLPVSVESFQIFQPPSPKPQRAPKWAFADLHGPPSQGEAVADVTLLAQDGSVTTRFSGLRVKPAEMASDRLPIPPLYKLQWRRWQPPSASIDSGGGPGWRLILADTGGVAQHLRDRWSRSGQRTVLALPRDAEKPSGPSDLSVDPADPADLIRMLDLARAENDGPCLDVLYLWSLDSQGPSGDPQVHAGAKQREHDQRPGLLSTARACSASSGHPTSSDLEASQRLGCHGLLHLVQALQHRPLEGLRGLWIVTSGAAAGLAEDNGTAVQQAPLLGMARVIDAELTSLPCRCADLSATDRREEIDILAGLIEGPPQERQVALRGKSCRVPRLSPFGHHQRESASRLELSSQASYLVTGGLGGLGLEVAIRLARRGAKRLVLAGRRPPRDQARKRLQALREAGVRVEILQADVIDEAQLAEAVTAAHEAEFPLKGVFHAAGHLDDGILERLTVERFRRVLAPKVQGAWNLHRLTADLDLDHFVLFSSVAALLGPPGQANHAAANAFLDALAAQRRGLGLPALSINWGPWAGAGKLDGSAAAQDLAERGLKSFDLDQGLNALEFLCLQDDAQAAVMNIEADRWRRSQGRREVSDLLDELVEKKQTAAPASAPSLRQQLASAPTAFKRRKLLEARLLQETARSAGLETAEVDVRRPFKELGLDSLRLLEMRNRLEGQLSLTLAAMTFWKYPSVRDLARHLEQRLEEDGGSEASEPPAMAGSGPGVAARA
ncbi:MAG TPA: type I polyketide synthase, partial [Acidobacteriota bacterium]|nr:type I polyketide synthase [Acidobacteriota bacterium]